MINKKREVQQTELFGLTKPNKVSLQEPFMALTLKSVGTAPESPQQCNGSPPKVYPSYFRSLSDPHWKPTKSSKESYQTPSKSSKESHQTSTRSSQEPHQTPQEGSRLGMEVNNIPVTIELASEGSDTPVRVHVELPPTRKILQERYDVSQKSLSLWCRTLDIERPGREGSFSKDAVELLDDFWIAKNVFDLTENEFINKIFLVEEIQVPPCAEEALATSPKLDRFIYRKHGYLIEHLLAAHEDYKNHPIVGSKLKRISKLKSTQQPNY